MSNSNGKATIGLIFTGIILVAGTITGGYKAIDEAKAYTDQNIRTLKEDQAKQIDRMQEDISQLRQDSYQLKSDTAVIRTILEERFKNKNKI